ncbi:Membrane dipeptidase (Peptidase family M19) [Calidithermus terrae]|uniref:Membrane dipeptidase (Peptidase family M19) n=1 Tax=Calidithermus terrae TaxID=1408545 RepID=A0A399DYX2_9DEIN|nr:membrane dipeptidase [Calidithermus terrae]RIH77056.1 Membrane dipeptidase (Peptidase family M19) [Calidithermus terrae]
MQNKRYSGYKSFEYLEPGLDYKPFKLAKELGRVPSRGVEVTPEQEERVRRIFEQNLIISLHDHCFVAPENLAEFFEFRRQGRDWTGYEGLSVSGLDCVFDNLMNGTAMITSRGGWKWDDIIYDLGMRLSDIAHQDMVVLATTTEDIVRAKHNGRVAFVVSLEGAAMIENELDRLDILYGLGVRCLGIAYSEGNQLGGGLREPNDGGLTVFGRQAVRRMNKLGIAIDISHSGDRTSMDTIEVSEKPVFITHAGARALWNSNRLKPDEVIKACAAKGGVIGIEAAPHTTITQKNPRHTIDSFMEHFEYCVELVGIDHVAFGPDVLFGDHVGLHHTLSEALSIAASRGKLEYPRVEWVDGLENPAEAFPNIVRWLVKHGYSDEDIAKAVGGNVMRVLKEAWYK